MDEQNVKYEKFVNRGYDICLGQAAKKLIFKPEI